MQTENLEEKLIKLYNECLEELKSIGIIFDNKEITINIAKRNNKRYGCCKPSIPDEKYKVVIKKSLRKYIIKYENFKKYEIEISKWVFDLDEKIIKNTIIHELLHCLPYCNNHGKVFKKYAKLINEKLGYNITRAGNKKEDFEKSNMEYEEDKEYKYKIVCTKCGNIFYRKRLTKNFVKKYRCSRCLGKLDVINI